MLQGIFCLRRNRNPPVAAFGDEDWHMAIAPAGSAGRTAMGRTKVVAALMRPPLPLCLTVKCGVDASSRVPVTCSCQGAQPSALAVDGCSAKLPTRQRCVRRGSQQSARACHLLKRGDLAQPKPLCHSVGASQPTGMGQQIAQHRTKTDLKNVAGILEHQGLETRPDIHFASQPGNATVW